MKNAKPEYAKLLDQALALEGKLSDCYYAFHNYSFGNQILAMMQIGAQPINTFKGWQALGRNVKKGEKAIELCMPITMKVEPKVGEIEGKSEEVISYFMYRRNWFGLSQTEGEDYKPEQPSNFNKDLVLKNLDITETEFDLTDGNTQGYSLKKTLAINPVAKYPMKTMWHEIAHIILGHTDKTTQQKLVLTRDEGEVEAESVAYILCNIFKFDEASLADSRGYIQHWIKTEKIKEESAGRIFKAVSKILNANKEKNATANR